MHCEGFRYNLFCANERVGYLNIIINCNEKSSTITDFSCVKFGKGFGSILLKSVINEIKNLKINIIMLDDMTNRYRQTHNIYLKFGFKYLYDSGPEMELVIN